ncbi:MAG: S8 family serine peptidase, partial [Candidatus Heimdallarchaeota archaeon]|nr:S8 family serine peptidase [Candidatus Heimdallarchaeota archaeon]
LGEGITTTSPGGGYVSTFGTSFSSPMVAGGVATLISALNNNSINWNPGVIKAALLRGALSISTNELFGGQGIANFNSTWNLINAAPKDQENTPFFVAITPKAGPISYLYDIPQGMVVTLPLTLVSSHPQDIILTFSGDLDGLATFAKLSNTYSQYLEITIDTASVSPNTLLQGNVTAMVGGELATVNLEIFVGETVKGIIGLDRGHTYWDQVGANHIGGYNIGEMVRLAMQNGYEVIELSDVLNSSVLDELDILWMPDPLNLIYSNTPSLSDEGFEEAPLLSEEIDAILNFVANGGSLLIDFNGYFSNIDVFNRDIFLGTNATDINRLISHFGIKANEIPIIEPLGFITLDLLNRSSLGKTATEITHYGNYLSVEAPGEIVVISPGEAVSVATYTNQSSGGRVLVAGTNNWLDNTGIIGGYIPAGLNNKFFAEDVLNWLTSSTQIIKTSHVLSSTTLSGSYYAIENGEISDRTPNLYIEANVGVEESTIIPTLDNDGSFSFSYEIGAEAKYRIVAFLDDEYIVWETVLDSIGPLIVPKMINDKSVDLNGSLIDQALVYVFEFEIVDEISGINIDSLEVTINDQSFDLDSIFSPTTNILQIIFTHAKLPVLDNNSTFYNLKIVISDNNGNESVYSLLFQIKGSFTTDDFETSTSDDPTGSFDPTIIIEIAAFVILVGLVAYLQYRNYELKKSLKKSSNEET